MKKKTRFPGKIAADAVLHFFKKPATIAYPHGELNLPAGYRGKLIFDAADCVGCNLCVRDCPSKAIRLINTGTKEDKKFEMILDLDQCIFCGQCVDSCNKKCLAMTQDIELGSLNKEDLEEIRI